MKSTDLQNRSFVPMLFAIISWHANSVPLSVVIDFTLPLNSASKCMTVLASSLAFLPLFSFLMNSILVLLSVSVTIAQFPSFPTIVSISKSPKRLPSASTGRSLMLIRLGMDIRLRYTTLR